MTRFALSAIFALLVIPAAAAGRPGSFDFYVLALTWSPSYCAGAHRPDPAQCGLNPPGFVVHGLWPEYERGYPQYCDSPLSRLVPRSVVASVADLMPSQDAVAYQWQKHGMCSGLRPESYFSLLRQARQRVAIPVEFTAVSAPVATSPADLESAFLAANRGMSDHGIAVSCDRDGVIEVRICLTRRLEFRRCEAVDRDACRLSQITLQPAK